MIIYAGIDGTSAEKDPEYNDTFKDSFVRNLAYKHSGLWSQPAFYHRGPYTWGFDTAKFAELAYNYVVGHWKAGRAKAVFLAGYSRGAAAMIEVAYWLKERENIPVECLILFDAVDRSTTIGGIVMNTPIASTVRQVIYPQRDIWQTLSRISFQNCGFRKENPATPFSHAKFPATHGGLGGTPWPSATNPYTGAPRDTIWEYGEVNPTKVTPIQDSTVSTVVWSWVYPQIISAHAACKQRLGKDVSIPDQLPGNPRYGDRLPPTGAPNTGRPGNGQRIHIVKQGDWLSKIAITYYGDMNKWQTIYNYPENKKTIGSNPDLIKPGQRLVIP